MKPLRHLPTLPSLLAEPDEPLIHRDLSWLQFNHRVLAEARLACNPVLERAKFLSISASNMDEFFMIRFASLQRSVIQARRTGQIPRMKQAEKIRAQILKRVGLLQHWQARALGEIAEELRGHEIYLQRADQWDEDARSLARESFELVILPQLTPAEPFKPRDLRSLGNLQLALVYPSDFWIRVPRGVPHAIYREGPKATRHIFFLDDLLAEFAGRSMKIPGIPLVTRLTRDADFSVEIEEDDPESIPDVIRGGIGRRENGRALRLQYAGLLNDVLSQKAAAKLSLHPDQLLRSPQPLGLHGLWSAVNQIPDQVAQERRLAHPPSRSLIPEALTDYRTAFDHISRRDRLLHHPYDSFQAFLLWIQGACEDPAVEAVEMTIYRTDAVSPILQALKAAAATKKVRVVIELRARFDELNNLKLADQLREAGAEVFFGFGRLKTHAKISLITRNENGEKRYYTHLSTGNYNSATARAYTDLAVLTANQEIGADARHFFDSVTRGFVPTSFKRMLSAPTKLHQRLLGHIAEEIEASKQGKPARIFAKVNALVDKNIIESLYLASSAGVKIDLIVRGACSLIPGVRGLSENIRVLSIVDRYLEHSRIYYFESSGQLYLSSADWMPRNFFSRLEIAYPVLDPCIHKFLTELVIPSYLKDTEKGRELTPKGTWRRLSDLKGGSGFRSQFYFEDLASAKYAGTPLVD